ncbi:uncharacterized protein G2W53_037172 [Senna tora]|uniref:Uncharacterized protein n=1 Tax=Senna tora TaxID=362788 RepID=A0A834SUW9_9FABA|nr:uncharacterized protein G2W53_037172 [Senna tora]
MIGQQQLKQHGLEAGNDMQNAGKRECW